jgi:hypothetical protein
MDQKQHNNTFDGKTRIKRKLNTVRASPRINYKEHGI